MVVKVAIFAFTFGMVQGWILTAWAYDHKALKLTKPNGKR